jgi:CRP-like cAMP-binding protein
MVMVATRSLSSCYILVALQVLSADATVVYAIMTPGDMIGERGIFFNGHTAVALLLHHTVVTVLSNYGCTVVTLLLHCRHTVVPLLSGLRTAGVRALTACELYTISKPVLTPS